MEKEREGERKRERKRERKGERERRTKIYNALKEFIYWETFKKVNVTIKLRKTL